MDRADDARVTVATDKQVERRRGLNLKAWLAWFAVGLVVAFTLQYLQARTLGGEWNALLSTWDNGPLRPVIEEELGDVVLISNGGHDGQVSFVVALDPDGGTFSDLRPDAGLRWRRILYPLISGIGGLLHGEMLLASLIVVASLGFALATASAADLASLLGLRRWVVIGVLGNLGAGLSVELLTPDALALGLALTGVALYVRGRLSPSAIAFALAALTKEQYLLFAFSTVLWAVVNHRRRDAGVLIAASVAPLAIWGVYVGLRIGGLLESAGAITSPFGGIRVSLSTFALIPERERVLLAIAYLVLVAAVVLTLLTRDRLLRYLALPWIAAAIVMSDAVWQTGNNALRVLLPLWVVAVFTLDGLLTRHDTPDAPPRRTVVP